MKVNKIKVLPNPDWSDKIVREQLTLHPEAVRHDGSIYDCEVSLVIAHRNTDIYPLGSTETDAELVEIYFIDIPHGTEDDVYEQIFELLQENSIHAPVSFGDVGTGY